MSDIAAQGLRNRPTFWEGIVWQQLRARRMLGFKFRRQFKIGPFIADFACVRERIIVELDGEIHKEQRAYDLRRDSWLRSRGFTVFRIQNQDLDNQAERALAPLKMFLETRMNTAVKPRT